jgi:hypothetical protein
MRVRRSYVSAVFSATFVRSRFLILVTALCGAVGCKGSIEGTVYGTDGEQPLRLTGHSVYLVMTSAEVATVLQAVCPANAADWTEKVRSERARFEQLAIAYSDSARDELARRRGTRRWTGLVRAMNTYRDSGARMDGRPPPIPRDLVEKLAVNRVNTDAGGRYVFAGLAAGSYLVAAELRDEFRWVPAQIVARGKAVANITPRDSRASCDVARGL